MWAVGKVGIVKYIWVLMYATIHARSRKGREEMKNLWIDVNKCLMELKEGVT